MCSLFSLGTFLLAVRKLLTESVQNPLYRAFYKFADILIIKCAIELLYKIIRKKILDLRFQIVAGGTVISGHFLGLLTFLMYYS